MSLQDNLLSMSKRGSLNPMWKGDNVGYHALHQWIATHKPKPDLCEICVEEPPLDLMNISGEYRRDVTDFLWVCRRDHMVCDGRLERLQLNNKRWRKRNG